ncbi:MAG TPA: iron-containing alcohol dehydrogenase [Blastocatellia bacterium]|nr:iron-containing alcohol dehydrogenase [Blastocatellia bacterium]
MESFDFHTRTRLVFGSGAFEHLGALARELGFNRALLVADQGMIACGYVDEAVNMLKASSVEVFVFHDFGENPDTAMVEAGRAFAATIDVDSIVALGGGSSLDCAKGINFTLTNGGSMRDYWGYAKASSKSGAKPMLPMIGVPTTAGTGSDAQSYALISDADTHVKMACGDPQAAFKIALLDPRLTVTTPPALTASAGYDAISHAVESYVTKKHNPLSRMLAREAWRMLEASFERVLNEPADIEARGAMLLGSHLAGLAIENSMLGATHACANPLTRNFGVTHGLAIAVMLPRVVRWNTDVVRKSYEDLANEAGLLTAEDLARRLEELAVAGNLPRSLSALDIPKTALPTLAEEAAKQWTGGFNPRIWNLEGAMEVYEAAL